MDILLILPFSDKAEVPEQVVFVPRAVRVGRECRDACAICLCDLAAAEIALQLPCGAVAPLGMTKTIHSNSKPFKDYHGGR